MRSPVHTIPAHFRLSEQLLADARAHASRIGMTFSELVRSALRREIGANHGKQSTAARTAPSPLHPNGILGPTVSAIVARASEGDLDCQRFLFHDRIAALNKPNEDLGNRMLIAMDAITWGRLVASRGNPEEVRRLAGVLCMASNVFAEGQSQGHSSFLMAECISILEQLAECGDDLAAVSAEALIKDSPVELTDQVRAMRKRATEGEQV